MADLSITTAEVLKGTGAILQHGIAGATITAGEGVYLDASTNTYKLADCNVSAAVATLVGIALMNATSGQPVTIQTEGAITIGSSASMTVGEIYLVSATAGKLAPEADIVSSDQWVTLAGVAETTASLKMKTFVTGVQIP